MSMCIKCIFFTDVVSAFEAQTPILVTVDCDHTVDLLTLTSVEIVLSYVRKKTIHLNVR